MMEMAATNYITESESPTKKSSMRYVVSMCLLFTALLFGRAVSDVAFYIFAGVSFVVFVFSSLAHCVPLLLFLISFASILKTDVDAMSFFTVLFFIVALKMLIAKKTMHSAVLALIIFFTAYCVLFSGLGQLSTIVTMVAGLLMLYCLRTIPVDADVSVTSFSLGIIFASLLALMRNSFPIVMAFVNDSMMKMGENDFSSRFVGLVGNPNYYTLDVIVALAVLISLMCYKKTKVSYTVCVVILSVFGLMSVSKSFLLAFALLLVVWFLYSIKKGAGTFMKFAMIALIVGLVVYYFAYDYVNLYLFRFSEDSGASLDDITTGRTDIWREYIAQIFGDFKILFFGNGLKTLAPSGRGTHNTYIESIFSLGIVGTSLFLATLRKCAGKIVVHPIMWIPVTVLLFRMITIGTLTFDNLWLYFALFVILAKDMEKENSLKRK